MSELLNECKKLFDEEYKKNPEIFEQDSVAIYSQKILLEKKIECVKEFQGYENILKYVKKIKQKEDNGFHLNNEDIDSNTIDVTLKTKNGSNDDLILKTDSEKIKDCKKDLITYFQKNQDLKNGAPSGYSSDVWGEKKIECVKEFGGYDKISSFVKFINVENLHGSAEENGQTTSLDEKDKGSPNTNGNAYFEVEDGNNIQKDGKQYSQVDKSKLNQTDQIRANSEKKEEPIIPTSFTNSFGYWAWNILLLFGIVVGIIILWKVIKYIFGFLYDVFNARRLIYLRVVLPRGESKSDRDREKELAKDMKEKIGRMSQVFRNFHKLGELTLWDNVMRFIFSKPKFSLIIHYEKGLVNFIIVTYPEYKKIIEGGVSAQYSEASIETVAPINLFQKKHCELIPLEPVKDSVYPIRIYKQLEDDPLNNIVDSIGKISSYDTFSMVLTMKPEGQAFNKRAQKFAEGLFRKDKAFTDGTSWWKYIVMPWKIVDFFISGPSEGLIKNFQPGASQGDAYVRMIKAEEEAYNTMGEEAGKPAFFGGVMIITTSDVKENLSGNINSVVSAISIFKDEFCNELDQPEYIADLFGPIIKPLWKFCVSFYLPNFFFKPNIFSINELSSIFHLPDGIFNRSPVIKWMDYKVLPCPDNLPIMKEPNGLFITGKVAEEYKDGDVCSILENSGHRGVGTVTKLISIEDIKKEKEDKNEKFEIITKGKDRYINYEGKEYKIIEKDFNGDKKDFIEIVKLDKDGKSFKGLKLYNDGVLLGMNVYRNAFTPIYFRRKDRSRHHYIIGKSGGGKSVYIASLARQDVWNGDGLCVIDPHGDLVEDVLQFVPKERAKDVVYFDAGNEDRPMGLNIFEIDSVDQADRVVNDVTEIFLKMFGSEIFGPRIQEYFKYGALTLLEDMEEGATLIDVPRIFTDEIFREYKVKKVRNPVVRNFWEKTYNAMGDREKQEIIPYFTSKFVSFITNRLIRNIIGQTKSAFRFRPAMDSGKILLINLSKGKIGELNSQLLGMIIVTQIYNAAMSRADTPEEKRRDFFLYVDEFQNYVSGTFADILSEARKYHLALVMAHQYIAQLESGKQEGGKADVKKAVFGNVGTMQSFKVGAEDGEALFKEYLEVLSAQDIVGISNFKVYIKLNINNSSSRVFSMDTIWTEDYKNPKALTILKEYCSKKYGRKREFVDAEIAARLGMMDDGGESKEKKQEQEQLSGATA